MSAAGQRSRILLDEEYYAYTQPPPAEQPAQPPPPPPQPSRSSAPLSAEEYVASTEHLFEGQAPSPPPPPPSLPQQPQLSIAERWTGPPVRKQTGEGTLTFVGWADPERHLEVWAGEGGEHYVRHVGGEWFRAEDVARAQEAVRGFLGGVTALEVSYGGWTERLFQEGGRWFRLERGEGGEYRRVEVPVEKLQEELLLGALGLGGVGARGYSVPDIAKVVESEPSTFAFMGVEDALRQYRLKQVFPELAKQDYVNFADVWGAILRRFEERYGLSPGYEQLRSLAQVVWENPDAWKAVQEDIERQLAETRKRQEELQRFYEAKALKQWDAEREQQLRQQIEQHYRFFDYADPITLAGSAAWRALTRALSLGLGEPLLPRDTGYFFEALFERYRELAGKPVEKPLVDLTGFLPEPLKSAHAWLRENFGFRPNPNLMAPIAREVLAGREKVELEVLEKVLTPEKKLAYALGYGVGTAVGLGVLQLFSQRVVEPRLERALAGLARRAAEHPESALAKAAERLRLVQREQLVPRTVDAWFERLSSGGFAEEGSVTRWRFAVRVTEWGRAEELLGGRRVPEHLKLGEREITLLPLEGGRKVPFAGPGSVYTVEVRDFVLVKGGSAPREALGVYGVGTGSDSLITVERATLGQGLGLPHAELVKIIGARVDYAKILEQAQGGLPRSVLLTEEGDVLAGVSRTPRIPVREVFTPASIPGLPPVVLPPKLPVREEERGGKEVEARIPPPKIPVGIRATPPDVSVKPLSMPFSSVKPLQAPKPEVAEFAAPKAGELSVQLPRVAPEAAEAAAPRLSLPEVQLPRLEPKLEPRAEPRAPQREEPQLPRLPPLPPLGGARDLPITRSLRVLSRKIWVEEWFGSLDAFLSGRTRASKRGKGRRGGRR